MNHEINCERVKTALLEYLLEESPAETRSGIEGHLKSCTLCSQELAELKQTISLVARAEVSEEIPRKIRIVAEPVGSWVAFWRAPARLAFAGAALLCVTFAILAFFHSTISYQNGNLQIAIGARPATAGTQLTGAVPPIPAASVGVLDQSQVNRMISLAVAAAAAEQQKQVGMMTKEVAQQMQQRWQRDIGEMTESLRYFQAAQTMLFKGQVQNQQMVSSLIQQSALSPREQ